MYPKINVDTYVVFVRPTAPFAEEVVLKVKNRDLKKLKIPRWTYKFFFFDQYTTKTWHKRILRSGRENISNVYYPDGTIVSRETLKQYFKHDENVQLNLRNFHNKKFVICRFKRVVPYIPKEDIVLPKKK